MKKKNVLKKRVLKIDVNFKISNNFMCYSICNQNKIVKNSFQAKTVFTDDLYQTFKEKIMVILCKYFRIQKERNISHFDL